MNLLLASGIDKAYWHFWNDGPGAVIILIVVLVAPPILLVWISISSTQEKKREAAELKQWIDRAAIARLSGWDRISHDDITETYGFDTTIESRLKSGILGPKTLSRNGPRKAVLLRRSRLLYETEVSYYVDDQKDGFEVRVPLHNFQVRITWDRGTAECWDALYDAVCKIDRKVINSRKSKSQPLTYTSTSTAPQSVAPSPGALIVHEFELRPIRNDNDLSRANEVAGRLAERGEENLDADEADYLDVLCGLIEDYEDARFPIATDFTPADRLRARMEARGMTQAEVAREAKVAESTISDLLSGKSTLGRRSAARLAAYFGVPSGVFLR